jgi:hypothetical protein
MDDGGKNSQPPMVLSPAMENPMFVVVALLPLLSVSTIVGP